MTDVEPWKEFGLAGLVIFALFCTLFVIVRWLITYTDNLSKAHREERKEWRESNEKSNDKFETVAKELTTAIRELPDKLKP